jgi:hypothetical protein
MSRRRRRTRIEGKAQDVGPLKIELLTLDCAECDALEQLILRVLSGLDLAAQILRTSDSTAFALYGLQHLPAVAINGQVVHQGPLPSDAELYNILRTYCSSEPAAFPEPTARTTT